MGDLSDWQIHSVWCDSLGLHGCSSHRLCTAGVSWTAGVSRSANVVVVVVVSGFVVVIVGVLLVRMFGV